MNRPDGRGTTTVTNGVSTYFGEFREGVYHGKGTLKAFGVLYHGQFSHGLFEGWGDITLVNKTRYIGEFKSGNYEGSGIMYGADGSVQQSGTWRNDVFVGIEPLNASTQAVLDEPQQADTSAQVRQEKELRVQQARSQEDERVRQEDRANEQTRLVREELLREQERQAKIENDNEQERLAQMSRTRMQERLVQIAREKEQERQTLEAQKRAQSLLVQETLLREQERQAKIENAKEQARIAQLTRETEQTKKSQEFESLQKEARQRDDELVKLRQQLAKDRDATSTIKMTARALVIGNGAYTNFGRLTNSTNDAKSIATKLRSFNIEVDLILDADRDTLVKALNDYALRATGKDVNLLFYAGHGLQIEGINYLIPTNMKADGISAGYIKLNGIALNAVMDYMPAKTRLIFLDACRDNPAARSLLASRGGSNVGLAPVSAATGTLIAYATKEGSVAGDGDGKNSPYTTALLKHLDAPLDIGIVLRRVRQTVLQMTSNGQEPWEYGSLVGDQLILSQMAR